MTAMKHKIFFLKSLHESIIYHNREIVLLFVKPFEFLNERTSGGLMKLKR